MNRIHPLLIIFILIFLWGMWQIVAAIFSQTHITNFPPKGTTIMALGDSLTEGVGAANPQNGYVGILEQRLNVSIVNKGIAGDTTRGAKERLAKDVLSGEPDIVIVLLGGNDAIQRIPREETFANLEYIIARIQEKNAVVLLLGIQGGILGDPYDQEFETLAKKTGSLYVPDILDDIIGNPALMSDQIHPNDAGYLKVADKIAPHLEMLIVAGTQQKRGTP